MAYGGALLRRWAKARVGSNPTPSVYGILHSAWGSESQGAVLPRTAGASYPVRRLVAMPIPHIRLPVPSHRT